MHTRTVPKWITAGAVIAIITIGSFAFGVSAETRDDTNSESAVGVDPAGEATEVVLYYFHGTRRCNTCRTIESYAKEALDGRFEEALLAGTLNWTVLNTDESEHAHFVKDFGLVSSSLVLVEVNGEEIVRHEVLQDAWTLVRDKGRFIQYIQGSVGEFLE